MAKNNSVNFQLPFTIAEGGTANTTFTAYSVICAGTTTTGALQNVSGVGTSGQVLASNGTSIPQWISNSGSIQQIVSTTLTTTFSSSSTTFTNITGLSLTITPASSSNKIILFGSISGSAGPLGGVPICFRLLRGATPIGVGATAGSRSSCTSSMAIAYTGSDTTTESFTYLDSPATTSATTYQVQVIIPSGTAYINYSITDTNSATYKRCVSTITAMETS